VNFGRSHWYTSLSFVAVYTFCIQSNREMDSSDGGATGHLQHPGPVETEESFSFLSIHQFQCSSRSVLLRADKLFNLPTSSSESTTLNIPHISRWIESLSDSDWCRATMRILRVEEIQTFLPAFQVQVCVSSTAIFPSRSSWNLPILPGVVLVYGMD